MVAMLVLLYLAIGIAHTTAQSFQQITWSAVTFTYHGEKLPALALSSPPYLTPLGARQALAAGDAVRSRYAHTNVSSSDNAVITGLQQSVLDPSQVYILTTDESHVSASALAFLQGLYPPIETGVLGTAGTNVALNTTASDSFPLGGYQYPRMQTVGQDSEDYIWIAGSDNCPAYTSAIQQTTFSSEYSDTIAFYESLTPAVFAPLDPSVVNFENAAELYEFASYQYNHNVSVNANLSAPDLQQLYALASQQELTLSTPGATGFEVSSIGGRTLVSLILEQLNTTVTTQASDNTAKLSILVGSYEPLMQFFSLSSLSFTPSTAGAFSSLPPHGSTLAFELFSYASQNDNFDPNNMSIPFPTSTDELYVRFMYRNGTDSAVENGQASFGGEWQMYSLFNNGNEQAVMSWADFKTEMEISALGDVYDWCQTCQTQSVLCLAARDSESSATQPPPSSTAKPSSSNHLPPAVAGIIGAVVTLAALILASGLCFAAGFRLRRRTPTNRRPDSLTGRGFKGAEKRASDMDVTVGGGMRHERMGSWEMGNASRSEPGLSAIANAMVRDGEGGYSAGGEGANRGFGNARGRVYDAYGVGESTEDLTGHKRVEPADQV